MLNRVYEKLRDARRRVPVNYFDRLYQAKADPWDLASSDYDGEKYRHTLKRLERLRYASALEVGCSVGALTRLLADRCDKVLGTDLIGSAIETAAQHCQDKQNVTLAKMTAPDEWPEGQFDLFMLSEVIYYLSPADVDRLVERIRISHLPKAEICLVHHWTNRTNRLMPFLSKTNHRHDRFIAAAAPWASVVTHETNKFYRLDILRAHSSAQ